jgi:hypothetical protein
MHDQPMEERLRATLRAEADTLPFAITTAELQRRLTLCERERTGRRIGLLAAGIAAIVVGGAFILATNPFKGTQVATTPQPTSTPSSGPSVAPSPTAPASAPSLEPSVAPVQLSALPADADAVDTQRADQDVLDPNDATPSDLVVDPIRQTAREAVIKIVCIGPDPVAIRWVINGGHGETQASIGEDSTACDDTIATFRYDLALRQPLIGDQLFVSVTPRTAYHVLVETYGSMAVPQGGDFVPPGMPAGTIMLNTSQPDPTPARVTTKVGNVTARVSYRVAFACFGPDGAATPGHARWSIGRENTAGFLDRGGATCDGAPVGWSTNAGLPFAASDVFVTADAGIKWFLVITDPFGGPTNLPPQFSMWAGNDTAGATSGPAKCVGFDGSGDSCGLELEARDGALVVPVASGGRVSFQIADGWTIKQARVEVADRAAVRKQGMAAPLREFGNLTEPSGRLTGSGDHLSLSTIGLDPGEWMVIITIQVEKGSHSYGGTYQLPLRVG